MDKNLIKNTAQRLNIYDESVVKKSEECLRLYQSKASVKTLNDQTKIILCLDLACQLLGKGFDKEVALTLCGLKKAAYRNNLNTLEKVLGLDRMLTVSDVCVQLGCIHIKENAEDILNKYKEHDSKVTDLDHPQYVAAATYLACKNKKISVDKPKILSISRLKPSQWKELVSAFEKIEGLGCSSTKQKLKENGEDVKMVETDSNEPVKKDEADEVEDYEVWKKRILEEAYAGLKKEAEEMEQ